MADQLKVVASSREVIENKLLTALSDDSGQVAILATENDLKMMISALRHVATNMSSAGPGHQAKARQWARDLEQLRRASFPSERDKT